MHFSILNYFSLPNSLICLPSTSVILLAHKLINYFLYYVHFTFSLLLDGEEDGKKFICMIMKYSILKIIYSEARIIRAMCQRYIEAGTWNYISSYSPTLLDHFYGIVSYISSENYDDITEPAITSDLLFLCSQQIEHFCLKVEPTLGYKLPFEVKFADILDCANDCSYTSKLIEWDNGFKLHSQYSLKDLPSMDFPWDMLEDESVEIKLECLLKTIKNNVRFNNYYVSLKEVWRLDDILQTRGIAGLKQHLNEPRHFHKKENEEIPCQTIHHSPEWRSDSITLISDEEYKLIGSPEVHSVEIELSIDGGTRPLDLPLGSSSTEPGIVDLHLYMQYPSQTDAQLRKTCIRVIGKNGIYTIKIHNHHIS